MLARERLLKYGAAAGLVAAAFLIRWLIHPTVGSYYSYAAFYPAVVIAAYVGGVGPALLAAAIAAPLAYFGFSAPGLAKEGLAFFTLTCAVAVFLMNALRQARNKLEQQTRRAEALASDNAELFRELNERVANHLQLVAGLLRVEGSGRSDPSVVHAFAEASIRTLQISKVHRGLVHQGDSGRPVSFDAFARLLLEEATHRAEIRLEPTEVELAPDKATSAAVVLLECLKALAPRTGSVVRPAIRVECRLSEGRVHLEVVQTGYGQALDPVFGFSEVPSQIIRAMTHQLDGQFSTRMTATGLVCALVFPVAAGAKPIYMAAPREAAPSVILH